MLQYTHNIYPSVLHAVLVSTRWHGFPYRFVHQWRVHGRGPARDLFKISSLAVAAVLYMVHTCIVVFLNARASCAAARHKLLPGPVSRARDDAPYHPSSSDRNWCAHEFTARAIFLLHLIIIIRNLAHNRTVQLERIIVFWAHSFVCPAPRGGPHALPLGILCAVDLCSDGIFILSRTKSEPNNIL